MKVVELFAGVGGFRLAAEKSKNDFDFIWVNQWEPNKKNQFAFDCYQRNFGESKTHVNEDIAKVKYDIPKNFDLLVGGFPCQDYSVATTKAQGIEGKKGVLWWEIDWIIKNRNPRYVLLENVDRLLKSPVNQRGRDFAIILRCFYDNGYNVEWMVNNGSDYGFAQRRKRVFIFAYKKTNKNQKLLFNRAFSFVPKNNIKLKFKITSFKNLQNVSNNYNKGKFLEYGTMIDGQIESYDIKSTYNGKVHKYLRDVIEDNVDKKYFLNSNQLTKVKQLKEGKKILRMKPNGESYMYSEGRMSLFDDLDKKSRTMLTSEGTINRSTHIIKEGKKYRFITPLEAERLNNFNDNWTLGMTDRQRYFCMGNALNVGLVKIMFDYLK